MPEKIRIIKIHDMRFEIQDSKIKWLQEKAKECAISFEELD